MKTVDDFLEDNESTVKQEQIVEAQSQNKNIEPSGVDSLLIGLSLIGKDLEMP